MEIYGFAYEAETTTTANAIGSAASGKSNAVVSTNSNNNSNNTAAPVTIELGKVMSPPNSSEAPRRY